MLGKGICSRFQQILQTSSRLLQLRLATLRTSLGFYNLSLRQLYLTGESLSVPLLLPLNDNHNNNNYYYNPLYHRSPKRPVRLSTAVGANDSYERTPRWSPIPSL